MSVTKTKPTLYHTTDQDVKYRLQNLTVRNINDPQNVLITTTIVGKVDGVDAPLDIQGAMIEWDDIQAEFSSSEKGYARSFMKAIERVTAKKIEELASEPHDDTDVFV